MPQFLVISLRQSMNQATFEANLDDQQAWVPDFCNSLSTLIASQSGFGDDALHFCEAGFCNSQCVLRPVSAVE